MKKLVKKISILGVEYKLFIADKKSDDKLNINDGYCDFGTKNIVLDNEVNGPAYKRHVIIHEIVHAFLHESGLRGQGNSDWSQNEQVVDWIAAMAERITKTGSIAVKEYNKIEKEKEMKKNGKNGKERIPNESK